jgi:hypothetical protein
MTGLSISAAVIGSFAFVASIVGLLQQSHNIGNRTENRFKLSPGLLWKSGSLLFSEEVRLVGLPRAYRNVYVQSTYALRQLWRKVSLARGKLE